MFDCIFLDSALVQAQNNYSFYKKFFYLSQRNPIVGKINSGKWSYNAHFFNLNENVRNYLHDWHCT